jgi:hydrophobe/amphiphile efflux-1 (HAE1) family protein
MSMPGFALRNRHTIYALALGVVVFGTAAYLTLPIQLFPDTAPPLVNVLTAYPGATAADVSDLVSRPIETESAALEGVVRVASSSQDGLSLVEIEFRYGTSVDLAAVDVQNALARIRSSLPERIGEPQVLKFSTANRPVLTVGARGDDLVATRRLAEDVLAPALQRVPGVAMVDVFGGHEPEIAVRVDRDRLDAHRLTIGDVVRALREHNVSRPAGQIRGEGRQLSFRVDAQFDLPGQLGGIPLTTPGGQPVRIGDLATITMGGAEDLARFRVDGEPAIAMQIFKQDDANTVAVVAAARAQLAVLASRHPDVSFHEGEEDASFTKQVVSNMLGSVWQALLLAAFVIFLFLGSFRRGLVVAVSMPMAFLLTFAVMLLLGIQVDMVTLTAVILAVGMVVDSSVVVLENITRRQRADDLTPLEAARIGAQEIQFAVIAGSLTTLVVLVPLLFLYGFIGQTFGPLAATMIIAFLSALLMALLLVPILALHAGRGDDRLERLAKRLTGPWNRLMDRLRDAYLHLLELALRRRALVLSLALVLLGAGLVLLMSRGMELLPRMDGGATFITIETPSGSSLDETEQVVRAVEQVVLAEPELVRLSTQMGFEPGMRSFGGGGVQGPTQAFLSITWTPRTARRESVWDIQDRLRDQLGQVPGIRHLVVRESGSTAKATTPSSIVVRLQGEDPLILDALGDSLLAVVRDVPGVTNPYRSWRRDQRDVVLTVAAERARELGLTPAAVATEMAAALDGVPAGVLREPLGVTTPIRVRYDATQRVQPADALAVRTVTTVGGEPVPLGTVVTSREQIVQGLVTREDLLPTLEIRALHQDRPLNFVTADLRRVLASQSIPRGYEVILAGEDTDMAEARGELLGALAIAVVAVYLVLLAQFRSFLHPLTVMAAIPLTLIGAAAALLIAGKTVSMPVMVGQVLLVGIVVNNSIILIDVIRQRRAAGHDLHEALLDSVRTRFRPIMMTSLSTIVGMIPLAMEWALGAERFSPLAIAVMGGLTAGTLLTMIVIPVLYDSLERLTWPQWGHGLANRVRR